MFSEAKASILRTIKPTHSSVSREPFDEREERVTSGFRSTTRNLVEIDECVPQGVLGKNARVPDDDAPEASTRECHVEAARVGKKTDALVLV